MNARKLTAGDMLVKAFVAEGTEMLFTLMGDANMYWSAAMAEQPGVRVIHARHEHAAVAMADGYARATGRVGVASTTCGPGFTQIMTALTMAARADTPLVVFAGDSPIGAAWYLQQIDMAPLALATGQLTAAAMLIAPLAALEQPWRATPGWQSLAALVALALVSTSFAYVLYFKLLKAAGATNILLVTLLVPVSSTLLCVPLLGEVLEWRQVAGMAVIALGLLLVDGRILRRR